MDSRKKVIILYASAGLGHQKAARAVKEAYRLSPGGVQVQTMDVLTFALSFFGGFYRQLYLFLIRYFPWFWGFLYYGSDIGTVYAVLKPLRRVMNGSLLTGLEDWLAREDPGVIIATHFMPVEVVSHLKEKSKIGSRLITVVTDYLPHCIWTAKNVDAYAVAIDETKEALIARGVAGTKIHVLGIPVEEKFLQKHSKEELAAKLNIRGDIFTVLLTSGGAAIGGTETMVKGLLGLGKSVQVLVVCGTNQRLFKRLETLSQDHGSLKIFGFVNNMDELMEVSDVVIGKGGGLTITEAFAKGKPVILFQSVPGQETRNVFCVEKYQAGYAARSSREVVARVEELMNAPEKLDRLRAGIRRISNPKAAEAIVRLAEHEA